MDDSYSALEWLIVEMIGARFGRVHPFEQLRREGVTRLVTGERPKAPDIENRALWTFRLRRGAFASPVASRAWS